MASGHFSVASPASGISAFCPIGIYRRPSGAIPLLSPAA